MNRILLRAVAYSSVFAFASPLRLLGQASAASTRHLSAEEWRGDLRFLAQQMRLKHANLFHSLSEAEFSDAVRKLDMDIPGLNDDQIVVRFAQLTALVQDGHTGFDLRPVPPPQESDRIPVRFDRYDDGVYVRAASASYADAVGGKVLKVGTVDVKEALRRVDSIESHDLENSGEQFAWGAKTTLNCPRLLHGLELSQSAEETDFDIEKSGQIRTFHMKASVSMGPWFLNAIPADWVDARPAAAAVPLSRQHEDKPFWFTAVPSQHAVYFQFNLVLPLDGESIDELSKRLELALQAPEIDRLVIDMRNNTGGDNTLIRSLLMTLFRSKENHRGGIYVIIGPATFSAAQNFVNRLENYADVVFVGTPTGENVNFYGDPVGIQLPKSHLHAAVSKLWWQDEDPRDARKATFPELAVSDTFADYKAGKDPVLDLALTTPIPPSIGDVLQPALARGLESAVNAYEQYVNDASHKYVSDTERSVNSLGYRFMGENQMQKAIEVFEVNVRMHPKSSNAYDSLGEGYARAGEKQPAIEAYRRSLELNPANTNAKDMILKLEKVK